MLVLFISVVQIEVAQVLIIISVARFLNRAGFIPFLGVVMRLLYSLYNRTSLMQQFCNSWHVRYLLVMTLRLNKFLKLAESIVS